MILPDDPRPLRYLYLDLNAYFASVEQQEDPGLRGRPVGVVPVLADTTSVIAASYEAKAYGVRTGTKVAEAKRKCPEIALVLARPPLYVHYHRRILEVLESVLPVHHVASIDEMVFRLIGSEQERSRAEALARRLKAALREQLGPCLRASIGIAPNPFLAKLGTDLQKPDGLVVIERDDLPDRLRGLALTEFAGINRRLEARLGAAGIFTSDDLLARSPAQLRHAFGSIVGERWWYLLRGYDLPEPETRRRSVSHSHVLPPELRTEQGAKEVLLRLAGKGAARLRALGLYTGHISVSVRGTRASWKAETRIPATHDSVKITEHLLRLWSGRTFRGPIKVGIAFGDLATEPTPDLFAPHEATDRLSHAVDELNARFGKNTVYLAGIGRARHAAPERIAFAKTTLLKEGKGDNEWVDPPSGRLPPTRPAPPPEP